jgi:hypothetical protein
MPSLTIRRFLDATISPHGDVISVRFETDTDQPLVLDIATRSLELALMPLLAALNRAQEKAGPPSPSPENGKDAMFLPMHLAGSTVHSASAANDPILELRLAPGRLPLRFGVSTAAAQDLQANLRELLRGS